MIPNVCSAQHDAEMLSKAIWNLMMINLLQRMGLKNMNTVECKFKCIHETSSHPNQNIRSLSLFEDNLRKGGMALTHKCFLVLLSGPVYLNCISSLYNSRKSAPCEAF